MKTEHISSTLTPVNIGFVIAGLVFLTIGLCRICPIQINKSFFLNNGALAVMLPIAIYFISKKASAQSWIDLGVGSARFGGFFLLLMVLLCITMAASGVLMGLYEKEISGFIIKHPILGPAAGTLMVASPSSAIGIIKGMWHIKTLQPSFICFLQTASLASFPLFLMRQMGFRNPEISAKMYIFGVAVSVLIFVFMRPLYAIVEIVYPCWVSVCNWAASVMQVIW